MRLMFAPLLGLVTACAGPIATNSPAAPAPASRELPCLSGAFGADASRDSLVAAFGAENVSSQLLEDEGGEYIATSVFTGDQQLTVRWKDDAALSQPASISVSGETSAWSGPLGLSLGMSLEDIERLNGRPFEILGFDWDYGGQIWEMRGGAVSRDIAGGYRLFVFFDPGEEQIAESLSGDHAIQSNDPALRAANPTVRFISYRYP